MQLTLTTLGTLDASTEDVHGAVRSLGRGKPVAMLAYLACVPGQRASREHLASLLWGDVESDAARQNLRQTLWYLKKKLGDGLLEVTGEVVALVAPTRCDRDDFLHAAHRGDFAAAVQRHPGPFIPDFAAPGASEFEQWCELERRRLTVTYLRCADALARQWLGEGKFRDAQELARRARDTDPMDQATWRLLLEALVAGSDALGAMSEAEHFEAFLAREEQEPEAASLSAMRLAQRVASAPRAPDAEPTPSIAAELVGREAEFSRILAAWEQARQGTPRALVISAAAGLGKSRLLRDVQARLRASRARCVLVRANPGDRHLTDGFVAEVAMQLAALSGSAAVSPGTAGVLVALAPALASVFPAAEPDRSEGEDALRRRALALVDLGRAVSEEHPVAVLLDDLHWADEHSARIIAAALTRSEHARLLVVLAKRPGADPRSLFSPFERIELPPLDLAAVTAFVSHAADLPAEPWAEMLPQQLLLATGGSPLLLVETLHGALEGGWLRISVAGAWQCDDPARVTEALREGSAVRQRVQRLAREPRHALLALALFGRPVELAEARVMMPENPVQVEEPLEVLERGGFISRSGTSVLVAHDEIADTVVDLATPEERRRVHTGIARYLAAPRADENSLKRAAEHARQADATELLIEIWRRFVRRRRRTGDNRPTSLLGAELLSDDAASPLTALLKSRTPLWHRRRSPVVLVMALLLVIAGSISAVLAWRPADESVPTFVFLVADSTQPGIRRLVEVRINPRDEWVPGAPLEATDANPSSYPAHIRGAHGLLLRLPDETRWYGAATDTALGDESLLIDSAGVSHFVSQSKGDDGIGSVSPDGRRFAALTSRFDTITDHMQVVTMSLRGEDVVRVTKNRESDRSASWRPDGTQIAVTRHYFEERTADRICLTDVDGARERCHTVTSEASVASVGWADNDRLLIETENGRMHLFEVSSQKITAVVGVAGHAITNEGAYRVCNCLVDANTMTSVFVFRANDPGAARPVMFRGSPLRAQLVYATPGFATREWLESLTLQVPKQGLAIDNVHRLRVEGRRADGAPIRLHDLRWITRDSTVAAVDSLGRLFPRRLGDVWVVVSAGGWRVDSARVRIISPTAQTVLRETWGADWTSRWQGFGEPMPQVVATPRGPALLPNGDGSYPSGAFLKRTFASADGFGLEVELSTPITKSQWQTLSVEIFPREQLDAYRRWDLRTGTVRDISPACDWSIPGGEGALAMDYFTVTAPGDQQRVRQPAGLNRGWHRLRLQLFADGRCAAALDGVPVGQTLPTMATRPDSVLLVFAGHDRFDGRLVVGPLEAWTGVRGGVDWTRLDEAAAPKKRAP